MVDGYVLYHSTTQSLSKLMHKYGQKWEISEKKFLGTCAKRCPKFFQNLTGGKAPLGLHHTKISDQ